MKKPVESTVFVFFAVCLASVSFADELIDLSHQLSAQIKSQKAETCHVYAAADLFETACFRATGKHVRVSELYLVYLHLKAEIQKKEKQSSSQKFKHLDRGNHEETVGRILEKNVCSLNAGEKEEEKEFYNFLVSYLSHSQQELDKDHERKPVSGDTIVNTATGGLVGGGIGLLFGNALFYLRQREARNENTCIALWEKLSMKYFPALSLGILGAHNLYTKHRIAELEKPYLDQLGAETNKKVGAILKDKINREPELTACLEENYRMESTTGKHEDMQNALRNNLPFICANQKFPFKDGREESHSAIVVGFKKNGDQPPLYLVRHAHGSPAEWASLGEKGCERMTVLRTSKD